MMTYEEVKGRYLPHEIIDLWQQDQLSFEDANLLLYGSKSPPPLVYRDSVNRDYKILDFINSGASHLLFDDAEIELPAERLALLE